MPLEESLVVIQGKWPETVDLRDLALGKSDRVDVLALESRTLAVGVGVEVLRFIRPVYVNADIMLV